VTSASSSSPGSAIVVASSSATRKYSQYVQSWVNAWTLYGKAHLIGIQPKVLIPRGSALDSELSGSAFVRFESDATAPIAHQTQVNRLLASRWLDCPDSTIVFTADIDMFPGTDDFFVRLVRSTPADSFLVARNVLTQLKQYPICYLSASAHTWRVAFENVGSAADVWRTWANPESPHLNWFIDQRLTYLQLNSFSRGSGQALTLWNDGDSGHTRLDRARGGFEELRRAITSSFSDYHAHRRKIVWKTIAFVIQRRLRKIETLLRNETKKPL